MEAFNDFMEHLSQSGELKREEGANEAITDLKSLMCGRRIGNNSPGNLKISGALLDRVAKTLIYGNGRKSAADLEFGGIKKALIDLPTHLENGEKWQERQYLEKTKEIIET